MQVVSTPEVIDNNAFDPFLNDALSMKASSSSTATESVSSDGNFQSSPDSPQRPPNRVPPGSPQRSPHVSTASPHHSPVVNTSPHRNLYVNNSPMSQGSPSDRGMVHTRTNFGKTRGYVPPMVPSTSPGRIPLLDPPSVPPSPRGNKTPFEEEDAPDDEAQFRTVRSLRPKPAGQYHSDGSGTRRSGRVHRRHHSATQDVTAPPSPPRPEAYISETDESSLGHHDLSFEPRPMPPSLSLLAQGQDTRQPSPEEPFDVVPTRAVEQEARHPSPIESMQNSPIASSGKKQGLPESPNHRSAEELGELRRRRRRIKSKKAQQQQFEMPAPTVEAPSPSRVTSTSTNQTSDLTDDTEMDPNPSFDGSSVGKVVIESEMDYHKEGDDVLPPPAESPSYEEFETGREASLSPQKEAAKPKSILKSKRSASKGSDNDDDDDSLFDFDGKSSASGKGASEFGGKNSALGKGASIRRSSLKSGNNSSNRRGRRPRRKPDEANEDDESLIQYGEVRQRSSSLQERTQEAWTFRSKRSFSMSSPKEPAGVQFGNTDTIHHFDDQETLATNGTGGTGQSFNSLYTKSPESEAEDLIKDLLLIGSGEHSNPGRRKLKFQPEYKRQLREKDDNSTIDDNTLGTTDVSLNTLDNTMGAYSKATPHRAADDDVGLETSPRKSNALSRSACESLDTKSAGIDDGDPLAMVWGYVESGMQALGLTATPPSPQDSKGKEMRSKENQPNAESAAKEVPVEKAPVEKAPVEKAPVEKAPEQPVTTNAYPLTETQFSELEGIGSSRTADEYLADEAKEEGKGSFGEVMDYIFGDPSTREKEKDKLVSSAGSVATTSTPLEEDPRLDELALHAVRSKHQVFDMVFDESFPVDIEKDIKFSLVKTKLPLGILFHENDGGCWITKVFPDGNAAKVGGVEVGDQLAAINGISAIKLKVDEICTLITEAPDPDNIELTFLRYTGQLHPVVTDESTEEFEKFEVTDTDALMKPPTKNPTISLRPLSKLRSRDPSPKPNRSLKPKNDPQKATKGAKSDTQKPSKGDAKGKKGIGKWFGKGKKKSPVV